MVKNSNTSVSLTTLCFQLLSFWLLVLYLHPYSLLTLLLWTIAQLFFSSVRSYILRPYSSIPLRSRSSGGSIRNLENQIHRFVGPIWMSIIPWAEDELVRYMGIIYSSFVAPSLNILVSQLVSHAWLNVSLIPCLDLRTSITKLLVKRSEASSHVLTSRCSRSVPLVKICRCWSVLFLICFDTGGYEKSAFESFDLFMRRTEGGRSVEEGINLFISSRS